METGGNNQCKRTMGIKKSRKRLAGFSKIMLRINYSAAGAST